MEDFRAAGEWENEEWVEEDPKFPLSAYMEYRGFIPEEADEFEDYLNGVIMTSLTP